MFYHFKATASGARHARKSWKKIRRQRKTLGLSSPLPVLYNDFHSVAAIA